MIRIQTPYVNSLKRASLVSASALVVGFVAHQAFGWLPSFIEQWLTLRKDNFIAAENFQYFGLLILAFSGVVVTSTSLGREPIFSIKLFWQAVIQFVYIGGAFVGVVVGLAVSVAVKQGFMAAVSGFLLAIISAVFVAAVIFLSFVLLQFPSMKYRSKRAEKYRKEITVGLGVCVFLVASWSIWGEWTANNAVKQEPQAARTIP
ncbi:hypothetical protein [Methylophilus sp. DW102]|uniref:hypothetical protein n=1 Tax=Methylophilus sp. DW102 TaxID=3095607 RepID=UPI00308992A4|nr:hypothetical protein MTDW_10890 [Methylophilus sp. DW102]